MKLAEYSEASLLATGDCPNGKIQNIQRLQKLQNLAETLLDEFALSDLKLDSRNTSEATTEGIVQGAAPTKLSVFRLCVAARRKNTDEHRCPSVPDS